MNTHAYSQRQRHQRLSVLAGWIAIALFAKGCTVTSAAPGIESDAGTGQSEADPVVDGGTFASSDAGTPINSDSGVPAVGTEELPEIEYVSNGERNHYFETLAADTGAILAKACRSQDELEADKHGVTTQVIYDLEKDAARAEVKEQEGGDGDAGRGAPRYVFAPVTNGQLWYVWDLMIDENWQNIRGGVNTYKAFQLTSKNIDDGSNDERRLEIRANFSVTSASAAAPVENPAGAIDVRPYRTGSETGSGGKLEPIHADTSLHYSQRFPFIAALGKWTRFWAKVDMDTKTFSLWAADEDREAVAIYQDAPVPELTGLDGWWWEFDTSQARTGPAGVFGWFRNLVVLHNVTPPFVKPLR